MTNSNPEKLDRLYEFLDRMSPLTDFALDAYALARVDKGDRPRVFEAIVKRRSTRR